MQCADQLVDVFAIRITAERSAGCSRHSKEIHHRHRAVVSGAHGDPFRIENGAKIMRMHLLEREGDHTSLVGSLADDLQARDSTERLGRIAQQCLFVSVDLLDAE